jgi:hypothetical protein
MKPVDKRIFLERYEYENIRVGSKSGEILFAVDIRHGNKEVVIKRSIPVKPRENKRVIHDLKNERRALKIPVIKNHSSTCKLLMAGEEKAEDGLTYYFLVIERASGVSLQNLYDEFMEQGDAFPEWITLQSMMKFLKWLEVIHSSGVFYNDVSIKHLFFDINNGTLKVIDLGNAEFEGEQEKASISKDIFQCGQLLYYLLEGEHYEEIPLGRWEADGKREWVKYRSDIDVELAGIIRKALHPNPKNRFTSAKNMLIELRQYKVRRESEIDELRLKVSSLIDNADRESILKAEDIIEQVLLYNPWDEDALESQMSIHDLRHLRNALAMMEESEWKEAKVEFGQLKNEDKKLILLQIVELLFDTKEKDDGIEQEFNDVVKKVVFYLVNGSTFDTIVSILMSNSFDIHSSYNKLLELITDYYGEIILRAYLGKTYRIAEEENQIISLASPSADAKEKNYLHSYQNNLLEVLTSINSFNSASNFENGKDYQLYQEKISELVEKLSLFSNKYASRPINVKPSHFFLLDETLKNLLYILEKIEKLLKDIKNAWSKDLDQVQNSIKQVQKYDPHYEGISRLLDIKKKEFGETVEISKNTEFALTVKKLVKKLKDGLIDEQEFDSLKEVAMKTAKSESQKKLVTSLSLLSEAQIAFSRGEFDLAREFLNDPSIKKVGDGHWKFLDNLLKITEQVLNGDIQSDENDVYKEFVALFKNVESMPIFRLVMNAMEALPVSIVGDFIVSPAMVVSDVDEMPILLRSKQVMKIKKISVIIKQGMFYWWHGSFDSAITKFKSAKRQTDTISFDHKADLKIINKEIDKYIQRCTESRDIKKKIITEIENGKQNKTDVNFEEVQRWIQDICLKKPIIDIEYSPASQDFIAEIWMNIIDRIMINRNFEGEISIDKQKAEQDKLVKLLLEFWDYKKRTKVADSKYAIIKKLDDCVRRGKYDDTMRLIKMNVNNYKDDPIIYGFLIGVEKVIKSVEEEKLDQARQTLKNLLGENASSAMIGRKILSKWREDLNTSEIENLKSALEFMNNSFLDAKIELKNIPNLLKIGQVEDAIAVTEAFVRGNDKLCQGYFDEAINFYKDGLQNNIWKDPIVWGINVLPAKQMAKRKLDCARKCHQELEDLKKLIEEDDFNTNKITIHLKSIDNLLNEQGIQEKTPNYWINAYEAITNPKKVKGSSFDTIIKKFNIKEDDPVYSILNASKDSKKKIHLNPDSFLKFEPLLIVIILILAAIYFIVMFWHPPDIGPVNPITPTISPTVETPNPPSSALQVLCDQVVDAENNENWTKVLELLHSGDFDPYYTCDNGQTLTIIKNEAEIQTTICKDLKLLYDGKKWEEVKELLQNSKNNTNLTYDIAKCKNIENKTLDEILAYAHDQIPNPIPHTTDIGTQLEDDKSHFRYNDDKEYWIIDRGNLDVYKYDLSQHFEKENWGNLTGELSLVLSALDLTITWEPGYQIGLILQTNAEKMYLIIEQKKIEIQYEDNSTCGREEKEDQYILTEAVSGTHTVVSRIPIKIYWDEGRYQNVSVLGESVKGEDDKACTSIGGVPEHIYLFISGPEPPEPTVENPIIGFTRGILYKLELTLWY